MQDIREINLPESAYEKGACIWNQLVMPITGKFLDKLSEDEKTQFYASVIASLFGAMLADFGAKRATKVIQLMAQSCALNAESVIAEANKSTH
jgi:dsRNA-specific ribonuclease